MKDVSPEIKAQALALPPFTECRYPQQTMDCVIRAWRDPDFVRGWEALRDKYWSEPPNDVFSEVFYQFHVYEPEREMFKRLVLEVDKAYGHLAKYHAEPKFAPAAREQLFTGIHDSSRRLKQALGLLATDFLAQHAISASDLKWLDLVEEMAEIELANGGIPRPNAPNADRTYVAKELVIHASHLGLPAYPTAASLLNAMFPDYEPIDAAYVQSINRKIG